MYKRKLNDLQLLSYLPKKASKKVSENISLYLSETRLILPCNIQSMSRCFNTIGCKPIVSEP